MTNGVPPPYRRGMQSKVAEAARRERIASQRRLTPERRVALALALGTEGLELFCQGHPELDRGAARRALARERQAGRTASAVMRARSEDA